MNCLLPIWENRKSFGLRLFPSFLVSLGRSMLCTNIRLTPSKWCYARRYAIGFFFLRVMANPDQIHTRFSAQVLPDLWELVYVKHVFMWLFHILVVAGVRFYTITYVSHGQCLCNLWHVSVCWGYSCNVLQNLSAVNILTWVLSIIAR